MPNKPHGFDETKDPFVRLSPYQNGASSNEMKIKMKLEEYQDKMDSAMESGGGSLLAVAEELNNLYYGDQTGDPIIIPITDAFKKNQESSFESVDPASVFQGTFGGPATMLGANMFHLNGILGKMWSGSNIGIGSFNFTVAIDFTQTDKGLVENALKVNEGFMARLQDIAFPYRPELGVFRPPSFCKLEVGVGNKMFFTRKWVGIRRCDIETLGMWQSANGDIIPTAYNCILEVEDMIVGREAD